MKPKENKQPEPLLEIIKEENGIVRASMPKTVEEWILLFKLAENAQKESE